MNSLIGTYFFLLFLLVQISKVECNICAIEKAKRIIIGKSGITQADCEGGYCCFENSYGCYLSKDYKSGFLPNKRKTDCSLNDIPPSVSISFHGCVTKTLSSINGRAVLYNFDTNMCLMKNGCPNYLTLTFNIITLFKYADTRLSCYVGGSTATVIQTVANGDIEGAFATASSHNANAFLFKENLFQLINHSPSNFLPEKVGQRVCYIGIIWKYSGGEIGYNKSHILFDNDLNTCYFGEKIPFRTHHSWPLFQHAYENILVNVTGLNMKCIGDKRTLLEGNLLIYIPTSYNPNLDFNGHFITCNLIKNQETNCLYECKCEKIFCKSIFVDITDESNSVQVCDVSFAEI